LTRPKFFRLFVCGREVCWLAATVDNAILSQPWDSRLLLELDSSCARHRPSGRTIRPIYSGNLSRGRVAGVISWLTLRLNLHQSPIQGFISRRLSHCSSPALKSPPGWVAQSTSSNVASGPVPAPLQLPLVCLL
jgi:hypothetical protein